LLRRDCRRGKLMPALPSSCAAKAQMEKGETTFIECVLNQELG
jgi:hypothetical protein